MPPPQPGIPNKRALPSKEATLFKELLTFYETRQLKKGQKAADQILKKFPEHGETMCMKGLVLNHMGKREEGVELVRKGILLDITSHICWHVFGLIQKGEKKYDEALKSYTQALKYDRDNINILRDAAHLQTQLRLFDGLVETRHILLKNRPNLRQHWIALAVAHHLNGNLKEAKKTMEHYEEILKDVPNHDVEYTETILYHVQILEELGEISEGLALLDDCVESKAIVEHTTVLEFRARLVSKSGSEEAENAWKILIERNPDCREYYRGFLATRGIILDSITDETRTSAIETLKELGDYFPGVTSPRRLALSLATGDEFRALVEPYVVSGLERGIPSLFSDVKSLYNDLHKQQVIRDIVERIRESSAGQESTSASSQPSDSPTTYLWTLYFLAQHYSFLGEHTRAMSFLALAIEHTPTLPELFACQARILKRAGDPYGAARSLDEARLLDGQDRFLNTKCAKYRFRVGLIDEANEVLGLFTKKDAASPGSDLEDMQSLLYLSEDGDAHCNSGKLGMALKRYHAIHRLFDDLEDDQFDFHGYSIRKFTINIYLELLKWEDRLRTHPSYLAAVVSATKIYVAIHDDPSLISRSLSVGSEVDGKKEKKKKAKKAYQKIRDEKEKKALMGANSDRFPESAPVQDDDPEGSKLLSAPNPLERAAKLLNPLSTPATKDVDVWIAIYDVAVRRKKYLQALKALGYARSLNAEHPELHIRLVEFRRLVFSLSQEPPSPIGQVLKESLPSFIPEELSLETFSSQYLQRNSSSPKAVLAAAKVSHSLDTAREQVEASVFEILLLEAPQDIKTALEALNFLKKINSPRAEEFRVACDAKFELSTVFKPPAELAILRKHAIVRAITDNDADVTAHS